MPGLPDTAAPTRRRTGRHKTPETFGDMTAVPESLALAERGATFPQLMLDHATRRPDETALREKHLGIWQTITWKQLRDEVEILAAGLAADGFGPGLHLALIGENRPRLYTAMIAAQSLGGIPVPLYQDAIARELVYVFENAEIAFAIVEDQEQTDKMLEVAESYPALAHIYYDDGRGLRNYAQPSLASYDELLERGRRALAASGGAGRFLDERVAAVSPDQAASMFYTSGTTGNPKGVVHTHRNLVTPSAAASRMEGLTSAEDVIAYLPMAWMGQNIFSYAQWLVCGFTVNCPESAITISNDMREIGPTYYFAPPRVLEQLLTQVTIRMEDASAPVRGLYARAMSLARRVGERLLNGEGGVGLLDRLAYRLADLLVYGPLRNVLGMSRVRLAYTAGEAIGPDLFVFYRSIGVNLKQLYGSTETAVFVCVQPDGQVKADTVGPAVKGVELRIAGNGEVLIRSPGLLREYYKNEQATRRGQGRRRLVPHRRRGLPRSRRPPEDHRPGEGRRQARRRRDVRAQVHREQAEVLPAHQGGGRVRRRARPRDGDRQHRLRGLRQPCRAAQPVRMPAMSTWPAARRSTRWCSDCIEQVNADLATDPDDGRLAGPPLPDPAQGARCRRRRADPHPQGAARLHRAEVRLCSSRRSTTAVPTASSRPR